MAVFASKTITTKAGRETEFEMLFAKLVKDVETHEHGTLLYQLCRMEPERYFLLEIYADDQAHRAHATSSHLWNIVPQLLACVEGEMEIQAYEPVGSFRNGTSIGTPAA